MAIKLRKPEPGEDRLSWCRGVDVEICTDDGRQKGKLDFRFKLLEPSALDIELHGENQRKVYEFIDNVLVEVSGLVDENGEPWEADEQREFVLRANELTGAAFGAYFRHIGRGNARKKN